MAIENNKNQPPFEQKSLITNSTMFYVFIASVGLMVAHYRHDVLSTAFLPFSEEFKLWHVLSLGALSAGVILIKNYLFEDFFPSYKLLTDLMAQLMGRLSLPASIYLAVLAAVSEEILFRTAIQPSAGMVFSAGLFALLHIGPTNRLGAWSLIAFLSGLIFAWTFDVTGSIWPSAIAHSAVNVFSMISFRKRYLAAQKREDRKKAFSQT